MVSKNTKAKRRAAAESNGSADPAVAADFTPDSPSEEQVPSSSRVSSEPEPDPVPDDPEAIKEEGNVAFKAGRYQEAIKCYSRAIGHKLTHKLAELKANEPAYFTNRAASYIGLKRFKAALDDCQHAITLTPKPTPVKVLSRLARCQAALGSNTAALATISTILAAEPGNTQAVQLKKKIQELDGHLRNFETAREKHDWGMARLALERCLGGIEAEESEKPLEWRIWRIELELARCNWDAANIAANEALRQDPNSPEVLCLRGLVLFLGGKLPQALQHAQSALRLDSGYKAASDLRKRVKDVTRLKDEGNDCFKANKLKEALSKYTEALELVGEKEEEGKGGQMRGTLLSNRATTLLKLGRHEDALVDTNSSLELQPTNFKALRTRARLHLHLENYDASIADFKSAIEQAHIEAGDAEVRSLQSEMKKAEVALKRSKTKDYYKILGLAKDCSESDIKKAYRKESLKHHPDKGGDEEKFKLASEAYAVLSDSQRRHRYDMGEDEDGSMNGGGPAGFGMNQADLAELFAQFHGAGGGFNFGGGSGRRGGFNF